MNAARAAGFTLIELVVTVAIVSLLATMAMPLTQLVSKRAREHELRANLRDIRDALDRYNDLWRYSCLPPAAGGSAGVATGAPNGQAPTVGLGTAAGQVSSFGGAAPAAGARTGAGGTAAAGAAGGLSGSTVQGIGGADGKGTAAVTPTPPKMECLAGASGWPKDLQTLVDGVNNVVSAQPGAKVYFLRRIPRDPTFSDAATAAEQTWGRRSSASSADDPQEGDDVYDVYSLSKALDLTGQPYRDW
jgi:prepilin-type N-terminal cleavage/methylation domain-containing protein